MLRACLALAALALPAVAADPPAKPNRLAKESSPYLLQHARNPVDWYPWGPEALEKAKKEGKLIFLSVGYSACHWCHVMEKDTFENADVAKVLNEHFVCIKVDREERPDIDDVYLTALQVTGSNGGWPLSMFLTPEAKPIFGGTYFPPDDKKVNDEDTIPGFKSILAKVLELHRDKKKELYAQAGVIAERTVEQLDRQARVVAGGALDRSVVEAAVAAYQIDPVHGGFGSKARDFEGTKFPRVAALDFLRVQSLKKGNEELAKGVNLTLAKMAQGGIYDHLGGGFHRYSTERTWTVPHFEKMLYDNAQLVSLYAEVCKSDWKVEYRRVIEETLAFVAREMTAPEGYFYSALDADSDGHEGVFYVWEAKELDTILGDSAEAKAFRKAYALETPNFEKTKLILRLSKPLAFEEIATFAPFKRKLFDARAKRNRPFLDTKLITAWNGQMIGAYARAHGNQFAPSTIPIAISPDPTHLNAAIKAAEFVLKMMRDRDGRLLRIHGAAPGEKPTAKGTAFLDDYAYLIDGLLALHAATHDERWLKEAVALQALQDRHYADDKRGGYFNTPHDGEKLFARGKDAYDGAQPSGNGITCRNLFSLAHATGKPEYRERAERCLRANAATLRTAPSGSPVMVAALDAILADEGFKTEATATPPVAKAPTESADVVTVELKAEEGENGQRTFRVKISPAKGWHVYANPVGNKTLAEAVTTVELHINGKKFDATPTYPEGTLRKDAKTGDYRIYEGATEVVVQAPPAKVVPGPVTVRVAVTACDEKNCLKPSTITADVKK